MGGRQETVGFSMSSHPVRSLICAAAGLALVAATLPLPAAAHPHGPDDDTFTFVGGGWGHGVGMSQYGALGRAEAGLTHEEILAFYYDGAELVTDADLVPDEVDVRIAVHNSTVFEPDGRLTVAMDGSFLDTTVNTLTVRRADGGWYINSSNIDWCSGFCPGTVLTVSFNDGEPVMVSNTSNGTMRYGHGQFQLTPAGPGVSDCGNRSGSQYCLVIGDLTMQDYLRGLDEMPASWPAAALKAQAIAGRSYATSMINAHSAWAAPFDLYTSTRDQEYRAWDHESENTVWPDIVDATEHTVLVYDPGGSESTPEVITAFYGSSNGGHTAANEEPHFDAFPYLLAKPDPYDAAPDDDGDPQNPTHAWERSYTTEQISKWLAEYPFADLDVGEVADIYISGRGPSGRIDDALVTLVGSDRTLDVVNGEGEPYGYRFYYALVLGCRNTPACQPVLSTKLVLTDAHGDDGFNVYTLPFADVAWDAPYAGAVAWMLNGEITSGTTSTTFSPHLSLTRAGFASFLWRFAGRPDADIVALNFTDVEPNIYYSQAVGWMVNESITAGCSSSNVALFCPDDELTASQMAVFLWSYAGKKYSNHPIPFGDIGVNDYYLEAARWMIEHRLWVDDNFEPSDGSPADFEPNEPVSRARMAMYLWQLAATPGAFDADAALPPLIRTP